MRGCCQIFFSLAIAQGDLHGWPKVLLPPRRITSWPSSALLMQYRETEQSVQCKIFEWSALSLDPRSGCPLVPLVFMMGGTTALRLSPEDQISSVSCIWISWTRSAQHEIRPAFLNSLVLQVFNVCCASTSLSCNVIYVTATLRKFSRCSSCEIWE